MHSSRTHSLRLALAFCALLFAGAQTALTQESFHHESPHFTVANIRGDYGVVATYGANIARALGTQSCDGNGHLKGSALVNQPGANNTRVITEISFTGTYTVNLDGTGKMVLTLHLPSGHTAEVTEDFVITRTAERDGEVVATEITDAQEVPSAVFGTDVFVTHTYTRRQDGDRRGDE